MQTRARLSIIASMAIFGTIGLFVRMIGVSSAELALYRVVIAAALLTGYFLISRTRLHLGEIKRELPLLLLSGAAMGFNWILLFEAYRYTTVAVATLCYYLSPVIILLLSPLVLKERLTALKAGCIATALVGMFLVSGVVQSGGSGFHATGILLGLGAAVFYAFIVLCSKQLKDISAYDTTIMELGISAVVMAVYNLVTVDLTALTCPPLGLASLAVVAIFHTGVCYALYFGSIAVLPAQTSALFSYIDPVVAILLSALLLERLCLRGLRTWRWGSG